MNSMKQTKEEKFIRAKTFTIATELEELRQEFARVGFWRAYHAITKVLSELGLDTQDKILELRKD